MTYVELIVVLSIFSVMSSIVLFNYNDFQARVDIKNLATDIALKIVEAQRAAIGGLIPVTKTAAVTNQNWKPTYGIYFNTSNISNNKSFVYFTDLDDSFDYTDSPMCASVDSTSECISKIDITKGNYISSLSFYSPTSNTTVVSDMALTFSRPNSGAKIYSGGIDKTQTENASYADITISSANNMTAIIRVWASGRVEIK